MPFHEFNTPYRIFLKPLQRQIRLFHRKGTRSAKGNSKKPAVFPCVLCTSAVRSISAEEWARKILPIGHTFKRCTHPKGSCFSPYWMATISS